VVFQERFVRQNTCGSVAARLRLFMNTADGTQQIEESSSLMLRHVLHVVFCRERGARALEERLEMKRVGEAPLVESAAIAAAAAAASTLPDVGQQTA
jgi:hypothetical protein